jgi:glycoprotein endo-alpha-1,2-mannosidase
MLYLSFGSITSFNEWGEGTQIEPARRVHPRENFPKTYLDYGEKGPHKYLHLTAEYAAEYFSTLRKWKASPAADAANGSAGADILSDEEVLQGRPRSEL